MEKIKNFGTIILIIGLLAYSLFSFSPLYAQLNYLDNGDFEETTANYGTSEGYYELSKAVGWFDEKPDRGADLWREGFYIKEPNGVDMVNDAPGNTYCGFVPSENCNSNCYGESTIPWAEMIQKKLKYPIPAKSLARIRYRYAIDDPLGKVAFPDNPRTTYLTGYTTYLTQNYTDVVDCCPALGLCGLGCWQQPDHVIVMFPKHVVDEGSVNLYTWYDYTTPYMVVPKQSEWFAMRGLLGVPQYTTNEHQAYQYVDDVVVEAVDWCSHPCFRVKADEPIDVKVLNSFYAGGSYDFTPNGDGFDDLFEIEVSNAVYAELKIVQSQNQGDNGTYKFLIPNGMKKFKVYWDGRDQNGNNAGNYVFNYFLKLWRCEDYGNDEPSYERNGLVTIRSQTDQNIGTVLADLNNPSYFVADCCPPEMTISEPFGAFSYSQYNCCPETLIIKNMTLAETHLYKAKKYILVENCTVPAGANITLKAGDAIDIKPNVTVENGAIFDAIIENPCPNSGRMANPLASETSATPPSVASIVSPKPSPPALPAAFKTETTSSDLFPNVPNPFRAQTKIGYQIGSPGPVTLTLYNATGVPVSTLVDEAAHSSGAFEIPFDASHLSEGTYFYTLRAGAFSRTRSMVVLR